MSRTQEKPLFTPIDEAGTDCDHDEPAATGCGCFGRSCFGWNDDVEGRSYLLGGGPHKEAWLPAKLKELKETSELVAGPKWKNFVRKTGRIFNPKKQSNKQPMQFQYSPQSYALNFAGGEDEEDQEGTLLHSFSSRFAAGAFIGGDQQRKAAGL